MKNTKKSYLNAFTLVELIIVIVILAILATISFVSYNSYNSSSRDSVRLVDIKNLTTWLNLNFIKTWNYPMPEGTIASWTINWVAVVYKWYIWDNVSKLAKISKTPTDPLTQWYYIYWISWNSKYFQISATLENWNQNSYIMPDITNADNWSLIAKVSWNYLGYLQFSSWSNTYLTNIPSLIFNTSWSVNANNDLMQASSIYFVTDKNTNCPYQINKNSSINNKDWNVILKEFTKNNSATLTWINITSITNANWKIWDIFSWTILSSFWHPIEKISSVITVNNWGSWSLSVIQSSCSETSYSWYTINSLNSWNNQTFYKSITNWTWSISANCNNWNLTYWTENISCNDWYIQSWNSCIQILPISCKSIKTSAPSSVDWNYAIDPDWIWWNSSFSVYCDMTTDWGGWTRLSTTSSISYWYFTNSWRWNLTSFPFLNSSTEILWKHSSVSLVTKWWWTNVTNINSAFATNNVSIYYRFLPTTSWSNWTYSYNTSWCSQNAIMNWWYIFFEQLTWCSYPNSIYFNWTNYNTTWWAWSVFFRE